MKSEKPSASVESSVAKRMASRFPCRVLLERASLHQAGMKIQIVRHHRGAEDADGQVEHFAILAGFPRWEEIRAPLRSTAAAQKRFHTRSMRAMVMISVITSVSSTRNPRPCNASTSSTSSPVSSTPAQKRQPEQQLQRDRGSQDFRQVAGGDGDFAEHPENDASSGANSVRGRPARDRGPWQSPAWRTSACKNIAIRLETSTALSSV